MTVAATVGYGINMELGDSFLEEEEGLRGRGGRHIAPSPLILCSGGEGSFLRMEEAAQLSTSPIRLLLLALALALAFSFSFSFFVFFFVCVLFFFFAPDITRWRRTQRNDVNKRKKQNVVCRESLYVMCRESFVRMCRESSIRRR